SDFRSRDFFSAMPAPLLLDMLESKLGLPAASGRQNRNADDDRSSVNQLDSKGEHPLGLASTSKLEGIAENLLAHNANLNSRDPDGFSLLPPRHPGWDVRGSTPQDADGVSPLHLAVSAGNFERLRLAAVAPGPGRQLADAAGSVPLWLTLRRVDGAARRRRRPDGMCRELVRKGACARDRMEQAAIYLCQLAPSRTPETRGARHALHHGAHHLGWRGASPRPLLAAGADPNTQMTGCLQPSGEFPTSPCRPAIHLAICGGSQAALCRWG
uniref:ANK_REP_REGION domain-containing protein n=1 Tax=Macrostomum lignano TaxID=282301 RepID=A0A1I8F6M6_9PLAT